MEHGESARGLEHQQDLRPDKSPDHKNLAVGEVDEFQHSVDHGIAQGDERVHEAQNNAIDEDLKKYAERKFQSGAILIKRFHANKSFPPSPLSANSLT